MPSQCSQIPSELEGLGTEEVSNWGQPSPLGSEHAPLLILTNAILMLCTASLGHQGSSWNKNLNTIIVDFTLPSHLALFPLNMKQSAFPSEAERVPSRGWVGAGRVLEMVHYLFASFWGQRQGPRMGAIGTTKNCQEPLWLVQKKEERCYFFEETPKRQGLFLRVKCL